MTSTEPRTAGPTPKADRAVAPDLARGAMLAFIAIANSALYLYGRDYGPRLHTITDTTLDHVISAVAMTFVDGRAYPMFAVLFGYGVVQIHARQVRAGGDVRAANRLVRRRSYWLLGFGLAHGVLLFPGDVLGTYGLLGLLLVAMLGMPDRRLLVAGALSLVAAGVLLAPLNAQRGPEPEQRAYLWSMAIDDPLAALPWRPLEWAMTPFAMVGVVAAALVGVWAARRKIMTHPERHRTLLRRTAVIGIAAGGLGGLPFALHVTQAWQPGSAAVLLASGLHAVTGIVGGLGYAALLGLLAARPGVGHGLVGTAVTAAGERSLSCYLAQSVVFVALLAPWAGALGGTLGTAAVAGIAVLTWVGTVIAADLLRRRGIAGPAERLLRLLTYRGRR